MSNDTAAKLLALLNGKGGGIMTFEAIVARIVDEFVVIPRADLPEIEERGGVYVIDNRSYYSGRTADERWASARRYVALAEYLDRVNSPEAVKARRRDELVKEFTSRDRWSEPFPESTRRAIDRIIELESKG